MENYNTELIFDNQRKKPRLWTIEEDERLKKAITIFGTSKWMAIAKYVGNGRTQSQCSQRWFRGLNPNISKNGWSQSEDELLLRTIQNIGTKSWTRIATYFTNRCDVQCRYRYQQLLKRTNKKNNLNLPHLILPPIWTLIDQI